MGFFLLDNELGIFKVNRSTDDCDMIVTTVNMCDKISLLSATTTGIFLIIAALFFTTG